MNAEQETIYKVQKKLDGCLICGPYTALQANAVLIAEIIDKITNLYDCFINSSNS